ncbi:MAG: 1-aminocyclopropane-1-carboxylate deaminase/D-cysteine desulfhydrase [Burkholderiaceae bacterium]
MQRDKHPLSSFKPAPTPLRFLPRFSEVVGAPVYIKQDDCGPISWAGSKARKVARIIDDARKRHVEVLAMSGPAQSNSCRILAAACAAAGIQAVLVLHGARPEKITPGLRILSDVQAEIRWGGYVDWAVLEARTMAIVQDYLNNGVRAQAVAAGCSSALGVLAMVDAARELQAQLDEAGVPRAKIVHASASGGMHAGFRAASLLYGTPAPHSVMIVKDIYPNVEQHYQQLTDAALASVQPERELTEMNVAELDWSQVGEGYEIPTEQAIEAGHLLARTEGLLVEASYTGKALAAVVQNAARVPGQPQVFWHSGGLPAYFQAS